MKLTINNGLRDIVITTEAKDVNKVVKPKYTPEDKLLMSYLERSSGYYGHTIDPYAVSSLDLYAAVAQLELYDIVATEDAPKPEKLPEGVVS